MLASRPLTASRPAVRPCEGKARSRESRIVRPGAGRDGGTGRQSTRTTGRRSQSLYGALRQPAVPRSEEHTSELQSLMRNSYAVFFLKKKNTTYTTSTLLENS